MKSTIEVIKTIFRRKTANQINFGYRRKEKGSVNSEDDLQFTRLRSVKFQKRIFGEIIFEDFIALVVHSKYYIGSLTAH